MRVLVLVECTRHHFDAGIASMRRHLPGASLSFALRGDRGAWVDGLEKERTFLVDDVWRPGSAEGRRLLAELSGAAYDACAILVSGIGVGTVRYRSLAAALGPPAGTFVVSGRRIAGPFGRARLVASIPPLLLLGIASKALALLPLDIPVLFGLAFAARAKAVRDRLSRRRRPPDPSRRPVRVAHLVGSLGLGGAQRQLCELVARGTPGLARHTILVMSTEDRFFEPAALAGGAEVHPVPARVETGGPIAWSVAGLIEALLPSAYEVLRVVRLLRAHRGEIDILHAWIFFSNVVGAIAGRLAGIPVVLASVRSIHSAAEHQYFPARWIRPLDRATVRLATRVIVNSCASARDYAAWAAPDPRALLTIRNGIDPAGLEPPDPRVREAVRAELGIAPAAAVAGIVGRLAPEKRVDLFLAALAGARERRPDIEGLVIGDGPLRPELEREAAARGLAGRVRFLGHRRDARRLMQALDVLVLSSVIEGLPNVILEAQLQGVPVVTTAAGGAVDIVAHERTGLVAPVGDAEALAEGIARLIDNPDLARRFAGAGRERVRSLFSVENMVGATERAYEESFAAEARGARFDARQRLRRAAPAPPSLCILVPELDRIGGYELAVEAQARELARRGGRALVVTTSTGAAPRLQSQDGIEVIRLAARGRRTLLGLLPRTLLLLASRRHDFDAIYCPTFSFLSAAGTIAGALLGRRTIVRVATEDDVREFAEATDAKRRLFLQLLRLASGFLATSAATARELRRAHVPRSRVNVLPNGVDAARFRPASAAERDDARRTLGLPPYRAVIGSVGRLVERKRLDLLLRAAATPPLRDLRPHVCIVGDGPERAGLRALARSLALEDRVTFAGEQGDVAPWLRAMDVFAFPSRREGSPNALLEAMATGLPVVATRIGGVTDLVEDGRSGSLVPPEDGAALAEALAALLGDERRRREMGAAARARAVERFSLKRVVDRVLATLLRGPSRDRGGPDAEPLS